MDVNLALPFITALIMLVFTIYVLQRYLLRRSPQFLFWGIGLAMFAFVSFAEAYLALAWNRWVFFGWYLCGAVLTAAWIGHGTTYLMVRKRWVHGLTALLVAGSLYAATLLLQAMPTLNEAIYDVSKPVSEQYGTKILEPGEAVPEGVTTVAVEYRGETVETIPGLMPLGTPVRLTTPFFNIYGTVALVGGALWSAYLFWRKQVLPNRVLANVLIAAGGLSIATASTLTRLGYGQYLYVGELLSAILMFTGFRMAARPQPAVQAEPGTAAAD